MAARSQVRRVSSLPSPSIILGAFLALSACHGTGAEAESPPSPTPPAQAEQTLSPDSGDAGPDAALARDEGLDGDIEEEGGPDVMSLDGAVSTSIGGPSDGRLEGAVPFPKQAPGVILNPRRLNEGGHFGTVEMIQALVRAAAVVDSALPGGHPLVINDLCFREGGPIPHHGSHQSGRDVDVLFYLFDREGNPRPAKGVPLNLKGRGWDFNDLEDPEDDLFVKLDAARSWRFLQALAEDNESLLQRVYLAEHLRTLMLKAARRAKAPRAARQRIEALTCQPGTPHDDHFHLRFFCSTEDIEAGCQDSGPIYPWRRQQLRTADVAPVISRPRRNRRRSKTVSAGEAATKAGAMHWKVTAFLREREAWSEQPHPGRPWCR